ncbi:MAG: response regulator [Desulfobaccales bacterium]
MPQPTPAAALIVDDEPDMCWALARLLDKYGITSSQALGAREALKYLGVAAPYRLAFVDAKLPDMDGLELARRLRQVVPGIRVVMVSGYFYRDDTAVQEAMAAGLICGFVAKPFDHQEILKFLEGMARIP